MLTASLPGSGQMAEAVATPEFRNKALLDLAAAANVVNRANNRTEIEGDHTALGSYTLFSAGKEKLTYCTNIDNISIIDLVGSIYSRCLGSCAHWVSALFIGSSK